MRSNDSQIGSLGYKKKADRTVRRLGGLRPPPVHERFLERAREKGLVRVHPIGAITCGRKGESLTDHGELVASGTVEAHTIAVSSPA